jgi:dihydropteroate synthase
VHKNKLFYEKTIEIKGKQIGSTKPMVMGILNITPDSFYAASRKQTENEIINTAEKMLAEGADILDIGAYSSRPNATNITEEEEWSRLKWVLKMLSTHFHASIISVDTFRSSVAEKSISLGADIINDISAGNLDENMFDVVVKNNCPYILMHMRGNPQTMQTLNQYKNITKEVIEYFEEKIASLKKLNFDKIIIDPGFGFAKDVEQNFELLTSVQELNILERPMLIGLSRKSMIYKTLHTNAEEALNGTTALNMIALEKGAKILRVHDVKEAVECVKLWEKLNKSYNSYL